MIPILRSLLKGVALIAKSYKLPVVRHNTKATFQFTNIWRLRIVVNCLYFVHVWRSTNSRDLVLNLVLTKDHFRAFSFKSESLNLLSTSTGLLTWSVSEKTMTLSLYKKHKDHTSLESMSTVTPSERQVHYCLRHFLTCNLVIFLTEI